MPAADITIMPVPRPCGVCGRPTTQFSEQLDMPYCGRDDRPGRPAGTLQTGVFGPPQRGVVRRKRLKQRGAR